MMLFSFSLTFVGFIAMSLAMTRHYSQIQSRKPSKQQVVFFQTFAWLCLISACVLSITHKGISVGLVYWIGLVTLAALLRTISLAYRPQWAAAFNVIAGVPTSLATLTIKILNSAVKSTEQVVNR